MNTVLGDGGFPSSSDIVDSGLSGCFESLVEVSCTDSALVLFDISITGGRGETVRLSMFATSQVLSTIDQLDNV